MIKQLNKNSHKRNSKIPFLGYNMISLAPSRLKSVGIIYFSTTGLFSARKVRVVQSHWQLREDAGEASLSN